MLFVLLLAGVVIAMCVLMHSTDGIDYRATEIRGARARLRANQFRPRTLERQ